MERTQRIEKASKVGELPQVFDYLDYRSFLRDRLDALQRQSKTYSQRWVARRAGIQSPQLLTMVVAGQRNLARPKVRPLGSALKLNDRETEYFELIVDLSQAEDASLRGRILERIKVAFCNGLFAEITDPELSILSHWSLLAVRELVQVKNFRDDPKWISKNLNISEEQAKSALQFLEQSGYLKRENGKLLRSEPSIATPDRIKPEVLSRYHLQILEKTLAAHGFEPARRYFESLTMAIPRSLMTELVNCIQRFVREVDIMVESHPEREEVFQLNIQLYGLSAGGVGACLS